MTPNPPTEKTNIQLIAECLFYFGVIALCASYFIIQGKETAAQKAAKKEQVLNEWFESGSNISCENNLKEKLRDPNSYSKNGDFNTITNGGAKKVITWQFRATNGFGGYNISTGMCNVSKDNGGTISTTIVGQ